MSDDSSGGARRKSRPRTGSPALSRIPSVERLLASAPFCPLIEGWGRSEVKKRLVEQLDSFRREPDELTADEAEIAGLVRARIERSLGSSLRSAINATGIIIHTNMGRSPIDARVWAAAAELATGYSNLELDLETGRRGRREGHVSEIASRLFGCESAILVNNNASAVLLLLAANARDREVVVSRGELVEIGGSFRVPDVIVQGGARLREVGTTNRTRAGDFAAALGPETAAFLRVHRSNFQIVGFTESPSIAEMVAASKESGVPLFYDEGSGRVVDLAPYGFGGEETIRQLFEAGVDVVTCSTDKLIGATQGGLIMGPREIIERCARHPLMRALRVGKESYAIVAETLRAFLAEKHEDLVPIYRMIASPIETLLERAGAIAARSGGTLIETRAALGGGTTPTESLASAGVAFSPAAGPDALREALLRWRRPILARIDEGLLIVDVRTIDPADDDEVALAAGTFMGGVA
jgi:L-seryl-tRNA(Ser) seleniumtransferase